MTVDALKDNGGTLRPLRPLRPLAGKSGQYGAWSRAASGQGEKPKPGEYGGRPIERVAFGKHSIDDFGNKHPHFDAKGNTTQAGKDAGVTAKTKQEHAKASHPDTPPPPIPPKVAKKVQAKGKAVAQAVARQPRGPSIVQRVNSWADRMAAIHAGKIAHKFGGDQEKAAKALSAVIRHLAHAARKGTGTASGKFHGIGLNVRKKAYDPLDDVFNPGLFDDPTPTAVPSSTPGTGGPVAEGADQCPSCSGEDWHAFRSPSYQLSCEGCGSKYRLSPYGVAKGYPTFMPLGYHAVTNHAGHFVRFEPIDRPATLSHMDELETADDDEGESTD
jgi:hypothetical protein